MQQNNYTSIGNHTQTHVIDERHTTAANFMRETVTHQLTIIFALCMLIYTLYPYIHSHPYPQLNLNGHCFFSVLFCFLMASIGYLWARSGRIMLFLQKYLFFSTASSVSNNQSNQTRKLLAATCESHGICLLLSIRRVLL